MKSKILIALLLLVNLYGFSQKKKQIDYLADFEYLYQSLKQSSITMDIYCIEHDFDSDVYYHKLKEELKIDNTFEKFIDLSQNIFNISADLHNGFVRSHSISSMLVYLPENERNATLTRIDTSFYNQSDTYVNKIMDYYSSRYRYFGGIRFYNGKYLLKHNSKINNYNFPYGTELIRINGIGINQMINDNLYDYFIKRDIISGKYYTNSPFSKIDFHNDSTSFSLKTPDGNIIETNISNGFEMRSPRFLTLNYLNGIKYLKKDNILYITLKFLDNTENLQKALGKYKGKEIDKLIIDVRGNVGGNDLNWLNLLSNILDSVRVKAWPKMLIKNNNVMKQQFQCEDMPVCKLNPNYIELENDILDYIVPNPEGLNYSGPIYCIMDNESFSSALCLSSMNLFIDNIKIVGNESPYYDGAGATPMYFMLPNSKLIYRVNATFDYHLYATKQYRVLPDIKVKPSINEELNFNNQKIVNYFSRKNLLRKNIFLKEIIKN